MVNARCPESCLPGIYFWVLHFLQKYDLVHTVWLLFLGGGRSTWKYWDCSIINTSEKSLLFAESGQLFKNIYCWIIKLCSRLVLCNRNTKRSPKAGHWFGGSEVRCRPRWAGSECRQLCIPSGGSRGEPVSSPSQLLKAAHISWLVVASHLPSQLWLSLSHIESLQDSLLSPFSTFKETCNYMISIQINQTDLPINSLWPCKAAYLQVPGIRAQAPLGGFTPPPSQHCARHVGEDLHTVLLEGWW